MDANVLALNTKLIPTLDFDTVNRFEYNLSSRDTEGTTFCN